MKKKFFAVLLAVLLAAGALPMTASAAASGDCSAAGDGSVTWKVENGTLTISGSGDMAHYLPGPSIHSEREPSTPWQDYHPKKVVFTSDVKLITREDGNWKTEGGQFWDNQEVESFEVEAGNKTLLAYDDCLYMKIPETGDYYLYAVPPAKKGRLTIMEGAIDRVQYSSNGFLTPCKQLTEIYFPSTWWTKHRPDFNSFGSSIGLMWLRTPSHISSYIVSENHPDSKSINGCIYTKDGKELVLAPHTPPNDEIRIAEGTETFEKSFASSFDLFLQGRHWKTEEPIKLYIPKSMTKFKVKLTSDAPPDWLQIYGYKGTEAERFAKEHNVQFFDLDGETTPPANFTDVESGAFYEDAVKWAVENKITQGETDTTFAPNKTCTRGQIVTFLWRANGSPEPSSTANPFVDVKSGEYYYKAMLWAKEKGITSGTDATHFSPNAACNRAQAVTFLWRANNKPAGSGSSFGDVPSGEYYAEAVKWANGAGVTSGETSTTFAPDKSCTRGQIVTFLYRDKA